MTETIWAPGDVLGLANASLYLEAVGHAVIAWIWLEQLLAVGRTGRLLRRQAGGGGYFFRYELPRTGPQFDLLAASTGRRSTRTRSGTERPQQCSTDTTIGSAPSRWAKISDSSRVTETVQVIEL